MPTSLMHAPTQSPSTSAHWSSRPSTHAHLERRAHLRRLIDEADAGLQAGDIGLMDELVIALNDYRESVPREEWASLIADVIEPHPVRSRIHEEPFTRRAFEKPRGYPGDAPLLDLVYGDEPYAGDISPLGARLHDWATTSPACRSVQERRHILASAIDRIASERTSPRILSLACGHLREAQRSRAVRAGGVESLVALDQDAESLAVVAREQKEFNVEAAHASVRRFIAAPLAFGTFDLAYSAGLFDYLADRVALAVTRALFQSLRPGGELLIANFAPSLRDIGYMEAIMDWHLIYRDEEQVSRFVATIPREEIAGVSLTRDRCENVVYLSVRKG
jgi:SAM-dependent methyltransferase